jgi:hypothetical protein
MPNSSPHSSFTRPRLEAGSLPEKSVSGNGLRSIQAADCARPRLWPDSRLDRPVAAGIQGKFAFPRPHPSVEPNCRLLPARHSLPWNPDPNVQLQKSHSPPVLPPRGFQKNALNDKKRAGCCVSRSSDRESVACQLYPTHFRRCAHSLQRFYGSSTQSLVPMVFDEEVRFSAPGVRQRPALHSRGEGEESSQCSNSALSRFCSFRQVWP